MYSNLRWLKEVEKLNFTSRYILLPMEHFIGRHVGHWCSHNTLMTSIRHGSKHIRISFYCYFLVQTVADMVDRKNGKYKEEKTEENRIGFECDSDDNIL